MIKKILNYFRLRNKIKKVKLVLLDVDGVMTDNNVYYDDTGKKLRKFNLRDGFGIRLAQSSGIKFALVTGKKSKNTLSRAKELNIKKIYQGSVEKHRHLNQIKKDFKVNEDEIAFISDDIYDGKLLKRVGIKVAVNNACREIKNIADYITPQKGGQGAVRNFLEFLLKKKGLWEKSIQKYY